MPAVGDAFGSIREVVASIPSNVSLENADCEMLAKMVAVFKGLDDCPGVGPTIASKMLAPLRPALFPIWDNPIAESYGFALNAAGYRRYLGLMQDIARRVRRFWQSAVPLEEHLKPKYRRWVAPLAKTLDEWNWIRITRGHRYSAEPYTGPSRERVGSWRSST